MTQNTPHSFPHIDAHGSNDMDSIILQQYNESHIMYRSYTVHRTEHDSSFIDR